MENTNGTAAPAPTPAQTAAENVTADKTQNTQAPDRFQADSSKAPEGSEAKAAAAEAMRKYKLKVDGQEVEVDEEELKRGYTHQRAANKKLQEGLKAKKQAEAFIQAMRDKNSLMDVVKKLGHDPRKLAEEYLAAQLEEEMLDPKEKELREYRAKLARYEEQEKTLKEQREKQERDALKAKYAEKYSAEFVEALKSTGLPPTKEMVANMARYVARAAKINFQMTAQEAAKLVQQDETERVKHRLKNATPEQIMEILEEEGLQKVRSFDTSRLKDPSAHLKTPDKTEQATGTIRRDKSKRMTPQEWRAHRIGK